MRRFTFKKIFQYHKPHERTTTVCVNGYTQIVEVDEMSDKQNFFIVGEAIDKLSKYEDAEEQGLIAPVVRCKDCRKNGTEECAMFCDNCETLRFWNGNNEFCSWGEREGEQ